MPFTEKLQKYLNLKETLAVRVNIYFNLMFGMNMLEKKEDIYIAIFYEETTKTIFMYIKYFTFCNWNHNFKVSKRKYMSVLKVLIEYLLLNILVTKKYSFYFLKESSVYTFN